MFIFMGGIFLLMHSWFLSIIHPVFKLIQIFCEVFPHILVIDVEVFAFIFLFPHMYIGGTL